MDKIQLDQRLDRIEKMILANKTIFNVEELSDYTGYSKSTIYKMVNKNILPFSKPNGKHLFFSKEKIDQWLLSNASQSQAEIQAKAEEYINKNKKA